MIELILFPCIATDGDSIRCALTEPQRAIIRKAAPKRYKARKWTSIRIRLKGINTPEKCEPGYEQAKTALWRLIRRKPLRCIQSGWSWNRMVATCFVNGKDIARQMVASGHAKACRQYGGRRYDPNARRCRFVKCGRRR